MAIDTPARIAVLGAGPVGLEAALYARYLGYDVDLYERGGVAENVLRWGHVRLFTPWRQNVSPLALAALRSQDESWRPPDDDALLTGCEFAERFLQPLAHSDLLVDSLRLRTEVLAVGREGQLKGDHAGEEAREDGDFRLLLRDAHGKESIATAEAVIDASGTYHNHNWVGASGILAPGERAAADAIEYGLPDVLGLDRDRYAGKKVLLVGAGYSAATSVVSLAELARDVPGTHILWITRKTPEASGGPIAKLERDRLAARDRLALEANALARGESPAVTYQGGTVVNRIERLANGRLSVGLGGLVSETVEIDRMVANVGYRPDRSLYAELQINECYASERPTRFAAGCADGDRDGVDSASPGPASLINPEPDFYVLGAKSFGRNSKFLLSQGLAQIRDLFTIMGDRANLDLYGSVEGLAR